ncbi:MAG: hypothetical protein KDC12_03965 [Flavobacteriales bacterium]|nr:hypothetical protein [Flavobacteriales bacterium]
MKGYLFVISLLVTLFTNPLQAQDIPLTQKAAGLCQSGDLIGAREVIDKAITTAEQDHPYCWYVKGYIHKEIYKLIEKQDIYSENRDEAVSAIRKSIELDKESEYANFNNKALEYLSKSYYNDALTLIKSFETSDEAVIFAYYDTFKELMGLADPFFTYATFDKDFNSALAVAYETQYYKDNNDKTLINKAIAYYNNVLTIDPLDYTANFNTAIDYYNQGVYKVKRIDYNTDIVELMMIQDECVKLFKQSLPYMLKAYDQTPERRETLIALMAIYRALNDYDRSEFFEETLERLIREGKIPPHSSGK